MKLVKLLLFVCLAGATLSAPAQSPIKRDFCTEYAFDPFFFFAFYTFNLCYILAALPKKNLCASCDGLLCYIKKNDLNV